MGWLVMRTAKQNLCERTYLPRLLTTCGGFLLAVLWIDMMFDTLVLTQELETGEVREDALSSIAAYYQRVTKDADPISAGLIRSSS